MILSVWFTLPPVRHLAQRTTTTIGISEMYPRTLFPFLSVPWGSIVGLHRKYVLPKEANRRIKHGNIIMDGN